MSKQKVADIIPFKARKTHSELDTGRHDEAEAPPAAVREYPFFRAAGTVAGDFAGGVFKSLRYMLFFVLMWLRPIVRGLAMLGSGLSLFGLVACLVIVPDRWPIAVQLGGASFGLFVLAWAYDGLIVLVSPTPLILDSGLIARGD